MDMSCATVPAKGMMPFCIPVCCLALSSCAYHLKVSCVAICLASAASTGGVYKLAWQSALLP
jgi:hypothetical protein